MYGDTRGPFVGYLEWQRGVTRALTDLAAADRALAHALSLTATRRECGRECGCTCHGCVCHGADTPGDRPGE